jgi:RecA-family ATPase
VADNIGAFPDLQTAARLLGGTINGDQILAPGPEHSATDKILSVKIDANAPDGFVVNSFSGDDPMVCRDYVREKLGLPAFGPNGGNRQHTSEDFIARAVMAAAMAQGRNSKPKGKIVAIYDYTDAGGSPLYQVVRLEPKDFRQRRPDGNGGWIWKLDDRRVIYRWPDLLKYPDATVFITEGEKDADRVASLGHCATTVAAGKWTAECIDALASRDIIILEDNDDAGRKKARESAEALHGVANTIRIVSLPDLPERGDISDWLDADPRRADRLVDVCFDAPLWTPTGDTAETTGQVHVATHAAAAAKAEKPSANDPLSFINIANWLERDPPPRDWAVPDRFPLRNVSLLSGEGSIGKTILLMQLAAAHVLGRGWLDTLPEIGPAIFLNAEDEESELHRRFVDITKLYDASLADLKNDLYILALAGQDAVLGHADRHGLIRPTTLLEELTKAAQKIKRKFIGLDTSADIFAGNENDCSQVRQFVGLLRNLAIAGNAAVIVCAHPSLTGINTGTGLSGSTAWHNSVRARAYLHNVTVDETEPDKTLRQLDFMKSNYSATADGVTLRWKDGVFVPEAKPGSLEKMAADAKADEAFMTRLEKFIQQGRRVSPSRTSTEYAPKHFEGDGHNKAQLEAAMERLFSAGKIRVEDHGKKSRPVLHIVPC